MGHINEGYVIGQQVSGIVEKILPYGVFICLPDGTRGYIRRRELSWASEVEPQHVVHEGQRIKAIVQELPSIGRVLELSRKAALLDPWTEFIGKCKVGDIVTGTVKQLMAYGVYVEIVPGVDGLVPLTELATWKIARSEDMLWTGDHVEAIVTRIDGKTRRVSLSIRLHMKQLSYRAINELPFGQCIENRTNSFERLSCTSNDAEAVAQGEASAGHVARQPAVKNFGRILIIDDEISDQLVSWLERHGYEAHAARTAEEACAKMRLQSYRVILIDLDLAGSDGIALIRQMNVEIANAQIAVMSIAEWLRERTSEIEEIGVVEVFAKPLDLDELERLLVRIGQAEGLPHWRSSRRAHRSTASETFLELTNMTIDGVSLVDKLHVSLAQLVEITRAEVGMIFYLDPVSQAISLLDQVGAALPVEAALYCLDDSPVKDVIREKTPVFENRISAQLQVQRRFRKLLQLLPFESCIGVPIEAEQGTNHALFLFHHNQDTFSHYRLRDAGATALFCATTIEREAFGRHVQLLGQLLVSGQLAAGIGHEVSNEMSGLEIQIRNLQTDCAALERHRDGLVNSADFQDLKRAIESLLISAINLRGTVDLFQQLMRVEDMGSLDVSAVLRSAATLLRPIARRNKIRIHLALASALPPTHGSTARLQQVVLNIMLNAIQHMAAKSYAGGILEVTALAAAEDGAWPIKLRFSDTGPGIHRQLWEKIFEMGFSTRQDGTGMGLFIARSVATSLGGRISVERSLIPLGTTFLLELRKAPA
jgi:signal transduction histidine kinase/predicted RNA-binding protein with RPS1 domain/ActR/RegA family two-component response regulator